MRNSRANLSGSFFPLDLSAISFLIVDDQPFSRRIVRSILHGFGSREVYELANGVEAIELAGTAMPHIIITDLIMPATSGIRLIGMLKALELSAETDSDYRLVRLSHQNGSVGDYQCRGGRTAGEASVAKSAV